MSIFNIMGPVMIGPSSSHTAGAARIGKMARLIFADDIKKADIKLHGSFASTAQGHGTDRAIVGGLLGFSPDDERIRDSFQLAEEEGMNINFQSANFKGAHPNTALVSMKNEVRELEVMASSIGGGSIKVTRIEDYDVDLSGKYPTLWVVHYDRPGKVNLITSILSSYEVNIAFMHVIRKKRGAIASSIIELDQAINNYIIRYLEIMEDIILVRYIPPL